MNSDKVIFAFFSIAKKRVELVEQTHQPSGKSLPRLERSVIVRADSNHRSLKHDA
jgi:hypothetical protein